MGESDFVYVDSVKVVWFSTQSSITFQGLSTCRQLVGDLFGPCVWRSCTGFCFLYHFTHDNQVEYVARKLMTVIWFCMKKSHVGVRTWMTKRPWKGPRKKSNRPAVERKVPRAAHYAIVSNVQRVARRVGSIENWARKGMEITCSTLSLHFCGTFTWHSVSFSGRLEIYLRVSSLVVSLSPFVGWFVVSFSRITGAHCKRISSKLSI